MPFCLSLASTSASLELIGGKAQSLARLAAMGLPVPPGFLLTTAAYKDFVAANDLQEVILDFVTSVRPDQAASVESASTGIQSLFEAVSLPTEMTAEIVQTYVALGADEPAVAVRSSATAEDLPDLSCAGQHDTYLHVRGESALVSAIRRCWASLWTARAIGYRARTDIDQRTVAMGVIVQVMVQADVSGILFTANPASGERTELIINSSFGLGEAIVGGQVTPDTYVLDRTTMAPKETNIGSKQEMIVSVGRQGTTTRSVPAAKRIQSSLAAEDLRELTTLSLKVEQQFDGRPQDIEWAVANGKCWLLQARPITNLPPAPLQDVRWDPPTKGTMLIRRQVVENMPDPLSPLFAELYLHDGLDQSLEVAMAQYNMPIEIEDFMERPMFVTVNGYAYCRGNYRSTWRLLWIMPKLLYWYATMLPELFKNVANWRNDGLAPYLSAIERWKTVDPTTASDPHLLSGVRALAFADAIYWFNVAFVLAAAKITDGLLNWFLKSRAVGSDLISGIFLRGFPSKALQAQQDLEAIAQRIHTTDTLREMVLTTPAEDLLAALQHHLDGRSSLAEIHQYLEHYGHQIYTLDFVEPTQIEDPLPVLLSLKALVSDGKCDTSSRQAEMVQDRESREKETLETLGPLRRWLFQKFLGWAQTYNPHREQALFYMGAGWPTLRRLALELGGRLVDVGTLSSPDDVFYLRSSELEEAYRARKDGRACANLGQVANRRRELREARKKLHPPGMVPENSRFKLGPIDLTVFETQMRNPDDSNMLNGFAVSPGKVTGAATVVLSPGDFAEMKPKTILVCPTTTPAWTPLFHQASGLVTDIGGILAHGSIVAREYGIPAVMGTGSGTQRIVSGQRITVDGDAGTVTILE